MHRVVLRRCGEAVVEARECADDGSPVDVTRVPAGELAGFVRERERTPVRWVWDDATRWYPALLDAGVRVERCTDLRLTHAVLRRTPFVDQAVLAGDDTPGWDALQPVTGPDPALFPLEDPADRLDPVAEHQRQQAALAASAERGRLGLLLAAESSGALLAAEMTWAGLPWRADVHDRLLTELLGPRPAPGRRPAVLEQLLAEVRSAFRAPGSTPTHPASCSARCRPRACRWPTPAPGRWSSSTTPASRRCCSTRGWPGCSRPPAGPGWRPGSATAGSAPGFCPGAW